MKDENIDELFRNKQELSDREPRDLAWDKLDQMLPPPKKSFAVPLWVRYVAVLAIASIPAMAFYSFYRQGQINEATYAMNEKAKSHKQALGDAIVSNEVELFKQESSKLITSGKEANQNNNAGSPDVEKPAKEYKASQPKTTVASNDERSLTGRNKAKKSAGGFTAASKQEVIAEVSKEMATEEVAVDQDVVLSEVVGISENAIAISEDVEMIAPPAAEDAAENIMANAAQEEEREETIAMDVQIPPHDQMLDEAVAASGYRNSKDKTSNGAKRSDYSTANMSVSTSSFTFASFIGNWKNKNEKIRYSITQIPPNLSNIIVSQDDLAKQQYELRETAEGLEIQFHDFASGESENFFAEQVSSDKLKMTSIGNPSQTVTFERKGSELRIKFEDGEGKKEKLILQKVN